MAMSKELVDLKRLAEQQGWHLEGDSGHIKWYPPEGNYIVTSSTPSDSNILKTIKKDLEDAGLILDKQQMKRIEKAMKNGATEIQVDAWEVDSGEEVPDLSDDEILDAIQRHQPEVWDGIRNSSLRKRIAVQMIREWGARGETGDFPVECATCDKTYGDPFGLAMHVLHHEPTHVPKWNFTIKDDVPPDNRHDCPACDAWFYLSQDVELWEHLHQDHQLAICPICWDTMPTNEIQSHMTGCTAAQPVDPIPESAPEPTSVAAQRPRDPLLEPDTARPDNDDQGEKVGPAAESSEARSDDDLFALLEVVLNGPVLVTRESLAAINDWMDATRRLMAIKEGQDE